MTFAAGSRHELAFVPEVTYGTTPNTPAMKRLRSTRNTINLDKDMIVSEENRADRQITDARHGNRRGRGDIPFEFSYGAFDDWIASALMGSWATNVVKAGVLLQPFSVERRFIDISRYLVYTGVLPTSLSLSIRPNAMVTGSIGILAKNMAVPSGTQLGAPTDVATNPPYDSFTGTIKEGGTVIASVTALDFSLENNLDPAFVVGSNVTPQVFPGRSNLTGTLSAYFENDTLLNKFLNEVESSIQVTLDGAVGGDVVIDLPRIKYSGASVPVQGEGGIVMNMPFQGLRDNTLGAQVSFTRVPA